MKLEEMTDQELNILCCKALGWERRESKIPLGVQVQMAMSEANIDENRTEVYWKSETNYFIRRFNFCQSLDLVQQYLVPVLRDKGLNAERQYVEYLLAAPEIVYSGAMHDHDFQAMNAPARVRVLAFLQAMGVQHETL